MNAHFKLCSVLFPISSPFGHNDRTKSEAITRPGILVPVSQNETGGVQPVKYDYQFSH